MNDVYYNPEAFGLKKFAEWDDPSCGSYEFDIMAGWERITDNRLFWAEDSGCSCPSPFEDFDSVEKLTPVVLSELKDHCIKRGAIEFYNQVAARYAEVTT